MGRARNRWLVAVTVLTMAAVVGSGVPLSSAAHASATAPSPPESPPPAPEPKPSEEAIAAVTKPTPTFDPSKSKLVERTETGLIYLNPDDTYTYRSFSGPIHWKDQRGEWQPIDTSLMAEGDNYRNRSGRVTFRFAKAAKAADMVTASADGWSVSFGFEGARPQATAEASGSKVRYRGAGDDGIDVRYALGIDILKEEVVLQRPLPADQPAVFRFPLRTSGVTAREDADGIGFYDPAGDRVARIPDGVAYDGGGDVEAGIEPARTPVDVRLVESGGTQVVEQSVDRAWLDDPARVYPVAVDPTFWAGRDTWMGDAFVGNGCGNCNYNGDAQWDGHAYVDRIGTTSYNGGNWEFYSYLRYDTSPANGQDILRADWWGGFYSVNQYPNRFVMRPAAGWWDEWGVTWQSQPGGCCDHIFGEAQNGQWVSRDMRTWVHNWTHGTWGNNGIQMDNYGSGSYFRLAAAESGGERSFIDIFYNRLADPPSDVTPSQTWANTRTPTMCGTYTDPNGDNGYLRWDIYDGAWAYKGVITTDWVGNGGRACATVPDGWLGDGRFNYRAFAFDGVNWSTSWFESWADVDTISPAPPTNPRSDSHPDNVPSGDNTVDVAWDPGSDGGSGVQGYSWTFSTSSTASLDASIEGGAEARSTTSSPLSSGTWYFHVATVDNVGHVSIPATYGPFTIDDTIPIVLKTVGRTATPYGRGEIVEYTVEVRNNSLQEMRVTVSDPLSSDLGGVAGSGLIGGQPCGAACSLVDGVFTATDIAVPARGSQWIAFKAAALGTDRDCSSVVNEATVTAGAKTVLATAPAITICDTGLGVEHWWSFVDEAAGPQAEVKANVANRNLVVRHTDATPIEGNGRVGYVLRRTYNAQHTTLLDLPGSIGAGWTLNVGHAEDVDGLTPSALYVPPAESASVPGAVTFLDRDGTRHVFTPNSLSAAVDVGSLNDTATLATLKPRVLSAASEASVCVDQAYTAPAGVRLSLWRYLAVTPAAGATDPCSTATASSVAVAGFVSVRPDRVRHEYSATGSLLSITDANGNELRYRYDNQPLPGATLGNLRDVWEPRSCADPVQDTSCRSFRFTWGDTSVAVRDPAGRTTTYHFTGSAAGRRLTRVANPDGTELRYAYQGDVVNGATKTCGARTGTLCDMTDPRGASTVFAYEMPTFGVPRLSRITDRLGRAVTLTAGGDELVAGRDGQEQVFRGFDTHGRVRELLERAPGGAALRRTEQAWDGPTTRCVQPDDAVTHHLLCAVTRFAGNGGATPDERTEYAYNRLSLVVAEKRVNGSAPSTTTFGYDVRYTAADGMVTTATDRVLGSGQVASSAAVPAANVLYAVGDRVEELSPRGNAGGSTTTDKTSYTVDATASAPINRAWGDDNGCVGRASNTGNVCEVSGRHVDSGLGPTTRSRYDRFGRRTEMTTPKAVDESSAGMARPFRYEYYADGERDLSGSVSAAGRLKAVHDPDGRFVVFAYDSAGNRVRTWDRNATGGKASPDEVLASSPSTYTETLYGEGASALSAPWRYVRSERDQLGNRTTTTVDANGNPTAIRPPRGNQQGTSAFDVTQAFDAADRLTSTKRPESAAATFSYDARDNRVSTKDPNGNYTVHIFDAADRVVETRRSRGPLDDPAPGCRPAGGGDAPIPATVDGRDNWVCTTTQAHDGVDNVTRTSDGAGGETLFTFDALHRPTSRRVLRDAGVWTRTDVVYDADGNVVRACRPEHFAAGAVSCDSSAVHAEHATYHPAGTMATHTTFREAGQALSTGLDYDADGNVVAVTDPNGHTTTHTYDLERRRLATSVPRDAGVRHTTAYRHDAAGNVTATVRPGNLITAHSYDAAHRLVDTVLGADNEAASAAGVATGARNARTRRVYDADGNVVAQFNPRAFTSSVTQPDTRFMVRVDYDRNGRPTDQWTPRYDGQDLGDPGLSTTQTTECPATSSTRRPLPVAGADYPAGVGVCRSHAEYDDAGRATTVRRPGYESVAGRWTAFSYTHDGLLSDVREVSPSDGVTVVDVASYGYDAADRRRRSEDALGAVQLVDFFADGLVRRRTEPPGTGVSHVTTFAYDADGRQVEESMVVGGATETARTAYYADGLLRSATDPGGNTTQYTYDAVGNATSVLSPSGVARDRTNPNALPTQYEYFHDNLLRAAVEPVSGDGVRTRRTTYEYDAAGRKTAQQTQVLSSLGLPPEDGGTLRFAHAANDRLVSEQGRDGATTTFAYDAAGNRRRVVDGTSNVAVDVEHYLDDSVRRVVEGTHATLYAYDAEGRVAARADEQNGGSRHTTTYGYAVAGVPTTMAGPAGTLTWAHDDKGRLLREDRADGSVLSYRYDTDDALLGVTLAKGTQQLASWDYTYDERRRELSQQHSAVGGGTGTVQAGRYRYDYDAAGRVVEFVDEGRPETLRATWDADGNRLSWGDETFTYNPEGSIATSQKGLTGLLRLYGYHAFGGMRTDGCSTYAYDGFDRLTSVTGAASDPTCPVGTVTYSYDGLDRQQQATATAPAARTTTFDYDGLGSTVARTVDAGAEEVATVDPAGVLRGVTVGSSSQWLTSDGRDTVGVVTAAATGAVACTARFDPWGEPRGARADDNPCSSGATPNDHWFRGERRDAVTGAYQLGSRTYDPAKGVFLTPDSFRREAPAADLSVGVDPLTRNRYSYVNGDPVNFVDPSGHARMCLDVCGGDADIKFLTKSTQARVATLSARATAERAANEKLRVRAVCAYSHSSSGPCLDLERVRRDYIDSVAVGANIHDVRAALMEMWAASLASVAFMAETAVRASPVVGDIIDAVETVRHAVRGEFKKAAASAAYLVPIAGSALAVHKGARALDRLREVRRGVGSTRGAPRAIGPAGNPGALTSSQRAQYLFDTWHPATFPNRTQSINYHLARHGNGRSAFEYTRDAQQFFSQNRNLATDVILRDGTAGLRIQTKVPLPGGGTSNVGGYWTSDGRLVTFWD